MSTSAKQNPKHRLINLLEWVVAFAVVTGLCYGAYYFLHVRNNMEQRAPEVIVDATTKDDVRTFDDVEGFLRSRSVTFTRSDEPMRTEIVHLGSTEIDVQFRKYKRAGADNKDNTFEIAKYPNSAMAREHLKEVSLVGMGQCHRNGAFILMVPFKPMAQEVREQENTLLNKLASAFVDAPQTSGNSPGGNR